MPAQLLGRPTLALTRPGGRTNRTRSFKSPTSLPRSVPCTRVAVGQTACGSPEPNLHLILQVGEEFRFERLDEKPKPQGHLARNVGLLAIETSEWAEFVFCR